MPRTPYQPISGPEAITPKAAPVNTYVRPADPAPSSLHGLAEGLSKFDAGLNVFLQKRQEKQDQADKIRGEAAFNANNQIGWAEAVRQGKVPANASPIFMQSFKQAQGNLAGIQMRDQFNKEYLAWPGRSSNDPAAFQQFQADFIKRHAGDVTDVDVLRGLNPHVQQLSQDGFSKFSEDSANSVYNGSLNTSAAIASHTIDQANDQALGEKAGLNVDGLYGDLIAQREEFIKSGGRPEDYDKNLVEVITSKAVEHLDPKILDLLDRTLPGQQMAIKDYPAFNSAKQQALDKLESAAIAQDNRMKQAQKDADKKRKDELTATVVQSLQKDPMMDIPEEALKELEKYNPTIRKDVAEARKTFLDATVVEDPREVLLMEREIATGDVGREEILRAAAEGRIKGSLDKLLTRQKAFQDAREKGTGLITSNTAKRYGKAIQDRLSQDKNGLMAKDPFGNPLQITDDMLEAQSDYENLLMDWEVRNPDASLFEREKFAKEAGQLILERVNEQTQDYTSTLEQAQKDQAQAKAQAEAAPVEMQDKLGNSQQSIARSPEGETLRMQQADAPIPLENTSELYRAEVKKNAQELGISEEEYNVKLWNQLKLMLSGDKGKQAPATPAPAQPAPPPGIDPQTTGSIDITKTTDNAETAAQIGGLIDSAINAGSTAIKSFATGDYKPVLDLLGHSEGTDKGRGYNETLGYGAYTGGDVELTKMTIGQVKELQGQMLRNPKNKWNSSAVGRYQIVRKTLRRLQDQLGISDNEVFDEKMQDRLAGALLEGRGLSDWKAGKITTAQFMNNLAQEWASLPTASGKGFYDGQRASVSTSDLASAFSALSGMKQSNQPNPQPSNVPAAYANIPDTDGSGRSGQLAKFMEWNPDPVGNHEANLKSIDPTLADVIRLAQKDSKVKFVLGAGKRTEELQKKAVEWGWSKTMDSDHMDGSAADLWPLDEKGAVKFDKTLQLQVAEAMKRAAKKLGVELDVGADWKKFQDRPHFAIKKKKTA